MANHLFLVTRHSRSIMKCFGESKYAACAFVSGIKDIPLSELNAFPLKPKKTKSTCKRQHAH